MNTMKLILILSLFTGVEYQESISIRRFFSLSFFLSFFNVKKARVEGGGEEGGGGEGRREKGR